MATSFGGSRDGLTALITLVRTANRSVKRVMDDVTQEQADWLPPGTTNPIGPTYLHIAMGLDMNISAMIQQQPKIWAREGWCERFGLSPLAELRDYARMPVDIGLVGQYHGRVLDEIESFFAGITAEDLARTVPSWRGEVTIADALSLFMAFHTLQHLGEISAVKGMQGMKGFLF